MVPGLFLTSVATLAMSASLFTRRSRSGWLDELDDIRGGALSSPDGEVSSAMADVAPLPESDTSPLAEVEPTNDPSSWWTPEPVAAEQQDGAEPPSIAVAPTPAPAPTPTVDGPTVDGPDAPARADRVEPAAVQSVDEVPVETADDHEPTGPIEAAVVPVIATTGDDSRLPPPAVESHLPPPPPAVDDAAPAPEPQPESMLVQPSPHPIRPQEMWHPQVAVATLPPHPEEQVDPADLADDASGTKAPRFRFGRLRAVTPEGEALVVADDDAPASVRPPARQPEADLFSQEQPNVSDESPLGIGSAPLVPERNASGGGALITGPVPRRRQQRDAAPARGRRGRARTDAAKLEVAETEAAESQDAETVTSAPAAEPVWRWTPEVEDSSPDTPSEGIAEVWPPTADVSAATAEVAAPSSDPALPAEPAADEPAAREEPAGPTPLDVGADGTVAVQAGIVRLAEGQETVVLEDADGVRLDLTGGWCWVDRPTGSTSVTITLAIGTLLLPAGTVALAVAEADGTNFVVVVGGEAQLMHASGRLRLRSGALVLASFGSEPSVDVAVESEILADPLVRHNLRLDATR